MGLRPAIPRASRTPTPRTATPTRCPIPPSPTTRRSTSSGSCGSATRRGRLRGADAPRELDADRPRRHRLLPGLHDAGGRCQRSRHRVSAGGAALCVRLGGGHDRRRQWHRRRLFGCGRRGPRPRRRRLGPSRRLQRREPIGPSRRRRHHRQRCRRGLLRRRHRQPRPRPRRLPAPGRLQRRERRDPPRRPDIPRNKIDEDCSGKDAAFPTLGANVSNAWDVNGASFTLRTLAITQQFPRG